MSLRRLLKIVAISVGVASAVLIPGARAQFSDPVAAPLSAKSVPEGQLMQTAELATMLKESEGQRPLMLQVGSRVMFAQAHIPGSQYAGPGSQASGLQLVEKAVATTSKKKLIVIYCGCCPWIRCPNIGPVYKRLHDLGFTNVKALYIPNNFGDDWVTKGYPTARGE